MVCGFGRCSKTTLLATNFIFYFTATCLVAWGLNKNIDTQLQFGENFLGDYTTTFFLPIALIACMMGLTSVIAGFRHERMKNLESFGVALALSFVAWIFDFIAMGFAVKEVIVGGGFRPSKLKIIEVFVIIMVILELLHFCLLHKNNFGGDSTILSFVNPSICNRQSFHNHSQFGTPHIHHQHLHGSILDIIHDRYPTSP